MSQSGGFCGQCGTPLTSKYSPCPNCGHTKTTYNPQSAGRSGGHCGQCGAPLASKYATCPNCGHTKTTYKPGKSSKSSTRPIMIAAIVIAGLISTIIGIDLYATQSLEIQSKGVTNSDFSTLTIHFQLSIYNPTVIPTSFDVIHADILYKSKTLGTATIYGESLPPSSYTDVSAKFELDPVNILALGYETSLGATQFNEDNSFCNEIR